MSIIGLTLIIELKWGNKMKFKLLMTLTAFTMMGGQAIAADIAAGKAKSAVCAACHGPDGISFIPTYPNLKGQKAAYTLKQLKAFKDKTRKDPVMTPQMAALSDKDMENIAAYYESLGN